MNGRNLTTTLALLALVPLGGCEVNNPARPAVTFAAPSANTPANGTTYNFNQQPITLSIANAKLLREGSPPATYSVEVATSTAFANRVFTREGIAEGTNGVTTVQLTTLDGNTTYYWRWRATVDSILGEPSATQSFFVRPNIVISPPTTASPAGGAQIFAARPTFTVNNAPRTGPAGTIFYEFQVSTSAAFSSLLATANVQEQTNSTSWTPTTDLPEGNIFWRARASDPVNQVTGGFSNAASFERKFGVDLASVTYVLGPNIATWKETSKITRASHIGSELCIEHTASGHWPAVPFLFDPSVPVEGNQWMFANIGGKWYGGAGHWYKPGQACKGEVDSVFFIDAFQTEPFHSLVLRPGDLFAVAASTPARAWPASKSLDERSDVVFVVW